MGSTGERKHHVANGKVSAETAGEASSSAVVSLIPEFTPFHLKHDTYALKTLSTNQLYPYWNWQLNSLSDVGALVRKPSPIQHRHPIPVVARVLAFTAPPSVRDRLAEPRINHSRHLEKIVDEDITV